MTRRPLTLSVTDPARFHAVWNALQQFVDSVDARLHGLPRSAREQVAAAESILDEFAAALAFSIEVAVDADWRSGRPSAAPDPRHSMLATGPGVAL